MPIMWCIFGVFQDDLRAQAGDHYGGQGWMPYVNKTGGKTFKIYVKCGKAGSEMKWSNEREIDIWQENWLKHAAYSKEKVQLMLQFCLNKSR